MRAAAYAQYRSLPAGTYEHVSPAREFPARPTIVTFYAPPFLGRRRTGSGTKLIIYYTTQKYNASLRRMDHIGNTLHLKP